MREPLRTRIVVLVLLAVAAVMCVPNIARAEMLAMPDRGCAGPGCEQIVCARPDQATISSRDSAEPLAVAVTPDIQVSLPQDHAMAVVPPGALVGWNPVTPLAPRSPPAA